MDVGARHHVKEFIDFINESGRRLPSARPTTPSIRSSASGSSPTVASAPSCSWPTTGPSPAAKWRSFELFARHVAPRFQGQHSSTRDAKARARAARPALAESNLKAVEMATAKYEAEKGRRLKARRPRPAGQGPTTG